jgi:hypothetical protein
MKTACMIAVIALCWACGGEARSASGTSSSSFNQVQMKSQPRPNFSGRWEGTQVIQSEMPRVVADLVFTIRDAKGELSGETMFHSRARQGKGKWHPTENFGSPMISPRVEGKVLTFKLAFRTREGEERTMDYKMELVGPDQAIFDYVEATATDMSARMTRKVKK